MCRHVASSPARRAAVHDPLQRRGAGSSTLHERRVPAASSSSGVPRTPAMARSSSPSRRRSCAGRAVRIRCACPVSVTARSDGAMNSDGGSPSWRPTWFAMRTGTSSMMNRPRVRRAHSWMAKRWRLASPRQRWIASRSSSFSVSSRGRVPRLSERRRVGVGHGRLANERFRPPAIPEARIRAVPDRAQDRSSGNARRVGSARLGLGPLSDRSRRNLGEVRHLITGPQSALDGVLSIDGQPRCRLRRHRTSREHLSWPRRTGIVRACSRPPSDTPSKPAPPPRRRRGRTLGAYVLYPRRVSTRPPPRRRRGLIPDIIDGSAEEFQPALHRGGGGDRAAARARGAAPVSTRPPPRRRRGRPGVDKVLGGIAFQPALRRQT